MNKSVLVNVHTKEFSFNIAPFYDKTKSEAPKYSLLNFCNFLIILHLEQWFNFSLSNSNMYQRIKTNNPIQSGALENV